MALDRRTTPLAEGLCCPRCGEAVDLELLDVRPTTWQDATQRVNCTAGDHTLVVSGKDIRHLSGVALKAA